MKVLEALSRRRTRMMLHPLEIVVFALLFGGAVLPWPWNGAAMAILIPGSFIGIVAMAVIARREWMRRRRQHVMDVASRRIERRRTALEMIGVALSISMTFALFDLCCRAASFDGLFLVWLPTSTLAVIAGISAAGYAAVLLGVSACAELTDHGL